MLRSKKTMYSFQLLLLLVCLLAKKAHGSVVSVTKDVVQKDEEDMATLEETEDHRHTLRANHHRTIGRIRYHFDENQSQSEKPSTLSSPRHPCSHVVVVGVGTSMSVDQYDKIAAEIVRGTSIVVVVSNHNVDGLSKTSAPQNARLVNAIYDRLSEILAPVCASRTDDDDDKRIVIGGHSSSGQAAFEAAQKSLFTFQPFAFFGLDPYRISSSTTHENQPLTLPALYWGLTDTTCFVNVESAAWGAYRLTSPNVGGKVLYVIDNKHNSMTHCVFTDHGCGMGVVVVCPTKSSSEWVYETVAKSLYLFLQALDSGHAFETDFFELPETNSGQVVLHVNGEALSFEQEQHEKSDFQDRIQWLDKAV